MTATADELRAQIAEETAALEQLRAYRPSYAPGPTRSECGKESSIKLLTEELADVEAGVAQADEPVQPPTDKQVAYLRSLINKGKWTRINSNPVPSDDEIRAMDRGHVSYLIDQLKTA